MGSACAEAGKEIWNLRDCGEAGHPLAGVTSANKTVIATTAASRPEDPCGSV